MFSRNDELLEKTNKIRNKLRYTIKNELDSGLVCNEKYLRR